MATKTRVHYLFIFCCFSIIIFNFWKLWRESIGELFEKEEEEESSWILICVYERHANKCIGMPL